MIRTRTACAALIALLPAVAGCLGGAEEKSVDVDVGVSVSADLSPVYQKIRELLKGVPCTVNAVSTSATSANLKEIAYDALDDVGPVRTHGEFDVHGDLAVEAFYNQRGFSLINISDPSAPAQLGFFTFNPAPAGVPPSPPPSASTYDVKFSADGKLVFAGLSDRILVIDVSDPTRPQRVSTFMHPPEYRGQAHMMFDAVIGGAEYLFVVPSISGTGMLVAKLDPAASGSARLELVKVYASAVASPFAPQALAPHDAYVTFDAEANATLLYLANGLNGIIAMDVDDPANAQVVLSIPAGAGSPPQSAAPTYYHSIQAKWIGGKRILATSAEIGYNTVKVFDVTDLKAPKFLGQWVYDERQPFQMEHNLQIVEGILFVAHYQQGLFGFDLNAYVGASGARLAPTLHFQPRQGGLNWDVVVKDGLLYLSDIAQGLYVVGYGCFAAGSPDLTSDG